MAARPQSASVAPLAIGYDERLIQANIQQVENPRRGIYILVTPENCDVPGATGAASAPQDIHLCDEVASKMGMLSVAPWGGVGEFCLGEIQSRIYQHMRAKFGRGPTVVSKKREGGGPRHTKYETFTSIPGTILPKMCQIVVVIQ